MQKLFSLLFPDVKLIQYFGLLSHPTEWLWSPHPLSQLWQFIPYWDFFHVPTALQYKWVKALLLCLVPLESLKNKPAHIRYTLHVLSLRFFAIWNSFLRAQEFFLKTSPPPGYWGMLVSSSLLPKNFLLNIMSQLFISLLLSGLMVSQRTVPLSSLLSFNSPWTDDNPSQCTVDPQPCWHSGEQSSSAANLSIIPICPGLVSFAVSVHMNRIPCEGN